MFKENIKKSNLTFKDLLLTDFHVNLVKNLYQKKKFKLLIVAGNVSTGKTTFLELFIGKFFNHDKEKIKKNLLWVNKGINTDNHRFNGKTIKDKCLFLNKYDKEERLLVIDNYKYKKRTQEMLINIFNNIKMSNYKIIITTYKLFDIDINLQKNASVIKLYGPKKFPKIEDNFKKIHNTNVSDIIRTSKFFIKNTINIQSLKLYSSFTKNIINKIDNLEDPFVFRKYFHRPNYKNIDNFIDYCYNNQNNKAFKILDKLRKNGYSDTDIIKNIIFRCENLNDFKKYSYIMNSISDMKLKVSQYGNYELVNKIHLDGIIYKKNSI